MNWQKWLLAALLTAGWLSAAPGYYPTGPVQSNAMGNVFTTAAPPEFTLTAGASAGFATAHYTVRDFFGAQAAEGDWDGRTPLRFGELGMGYYTLELTDGGERLDKVSFCIVSDPDGRAPNRGFYCIDTAHSWIARTPPPQGADTFRAAAELARLLGAYSSRDRLSWTETAPAPDAIDWQHYLRCTEYMRREGVEVLGMFHDAPQTVRRLTRSVPDDLFGVYRFCETLGNDFRDSVRAWEFWNEQNATWFNWDAVWEMAAAHKAAYLGFKHASPEITVLPGGLTEWIGSAPEYFDFLMANGLYDYFDALAFHLYGPLATYRRYIGGLNRVYDRYRRTPKPLWITESGTHRDGMALDPPLYSRSGDYGFPVQEAVYDNWEHSEGQEQVWAEFIVKSNIEMQMLGAVRNYPFVFLPYNERDGKKSWGFFRWNYSVKPVFQALANQIEQTGAAELLGALTWQEGVRACLYRQPDGSQTVVFWTSQGALDECNDYAGYTAETLPAYTAALGAIPVEAAVPDGRYTLVDLMGGTAGAEARNGKISLTATKYPAYLHGLSGLTPDIPADPPGHGEASRIDETVVIQLVTPQRDRIRNQRYLFLEEGDRFEVEVYNFSDRPKTGRIVSGSALALALPQEAITVPAMGKVGFPMVYTGTERPERDMFLVLTGEFDGKAVSPLAAPVVLPGSMNRIFREDAVAPERLADASSGRITRGNGGRTARFEIDFTGVDDAWFYPAVSLDGEEASGSLCALSFDIRAEQQEGEGYQYVFVIPRDAEGREARLEYPAPDGEWRNVFLMVDRSLPERDAIDLSQVRSIAIGLNPRARRQTVEIRDLRLYFSR